MTGIQTLSKHFIGTTFHLDVTRKQNPNTNQHSIPGITSEWEAGPNTDQTLTSSGQPFTYVYLGFLVNHASDQISNPAQAGAEG